MTAAVTASDPEVVALAAVLGLDAERVAASASSRASVARRLVVCAVFYLAAAAVVVGMLYALALLAWAAFGSLT